MHCYVLKKTRNFPFRFVPFFSIVPPHLNALVRLFLLFVLNKFVCLQTQFLCLIAAKSNVLL